MSENVALEKKNNKPVLIVALIIVMMIVIGLIIFFMTSKGKGTNDYSVCIDSANKYIEELRYDLAIASFEDAIAIDPVSVDAYIGLAGVYATIEDYDMAISVLVDALDYVSDEDKQIILDEIERIKEIIEYANNSAVSADEIMYSEPYFDVWMCMEFDPENPNYTENITFTSVTMQYVDNTTFSAVNYSYIPGAEVTSRGIKNNGVWDNDNIETVDSANNLMNDLNGFFDRYFMSRETELKNYFISAVNRGERMSTTFDMVEKVDSLTFTMANGEKCTIPVIATSFGTGWCESADIFDNQVYTIMKDGTVIAAMDASFVLDPAYNEVIINGYGLNWNIE